MLTEIANWSSIRKFEKKSVAREKLVSIMEAGRRAPSWKNIQPWKFIAIEKEADKDKLSEAFAMGGLIKRAPAIILCVGLLEAWEQSNQHKRLKELFDNAGFSMSDENISKTYLDTELAQALAQKSASLMARMFENIGIAYGFMIIEAMSQGLGACIVGELDNELVAVNSKKYAEVKQHFGLGKSQVITAAIIIGTLVKRTPVNPRKSIEETYSFFGE